MQKFIGRNLLLIIGLGLSLQSAAARNKIYPDVYPYVPMPLQGQDGIYFDMVKVTEDRDFIKNFDEIIDTGLSSGKTKEKPWGASYWPLSKGTIADPFEESKVPYYVDWSWVAWEQNVSEFEKRKKKVLSRVYELDEEELARLAPSEKYDLLLGDLSFDLTHRLWDYMKRWGDKKENGFKISGLVTGENLLDEAKRMVDLGWYRSPEQALEKSWTLNTSLAPKKAIQLMKNGKFKNIEFAWEEAVEFAKKEATNYVEEKKNSLIAGWEGICNGWSTAAGLVPRPRRSVSFKLPNGKNLKFYPADIRGLVSLYYVNSLIQGPVEWKNIAKDGLPKAQGTVSAGLRCNLKRARKDKWGRLYDHKDDPFLGRNTFTGKRESRCAGVHPAKWHMGLVNIIGKQQRSFIVERKVGSAVDNHPMYKYEMKYFNPNTGTFNDNIEANIVRINKHDQFRRFRHKKAKYIVGVETEINYLDYGKPTRKDETSEKDDLDVDKKMIYDLELDANKNIVGGQWRAKYFGAYEHQRIGGQDSPKDYNHNQPDFFWLLTKNYKDAGGFDDVEGLESWKDKSTSPPSSWKKKAIGTPKQGPYVQKGETDGYHGFHFKKTLRLGAPDNCRYANKKTGEFETFLCEYSINMPQPLINIVNTLVERAK